MDTQQAPTFEEALSTVVSQLPAGIQEFFVSGKVGIVARNLMQKYQLHIDQGAIVEREIILLLLGLKNPVEFTQALAEEARLDQQTINGIVQDVNEQIFIPLQKEMRSGATVATEPPRSAMPQLRPPAAAASAPPRPVSVPIPSYAPRPFEARQSAGVVGPPAPRPAVSAPPQSYAPPVTGLPKGSLAPPLQSPSYFNLENKIAPARAIQTPLNTGRSSISNIAPLPPKFVLSPTAPVTGLSKGNSPTVTASSRLMAPTGTMERRLLEDHEEPHIEFPPLLMLPVESPASRATDGIARPFIPPRTVPPRPVTPPPNLPGALRPPEVFAVPTIASGEGRGGGGITPRVIPAGARAEFTVPKVVPPVVSTLPKPSTPTSPIKHYSGDPYREPIE
jgi:hypothetical protein